MKYELAKKLKDAGFPLRVSQDNTSCLDLHDGSTVYYEEPTLSELIEACGEYFGSLNKGPEAGEWFAYPKNGIPMAMGIAQVFKESTPDEAVAELWIALNPITV